MAERQKTTMIEELNKLRETVNTQNERTRILLDATPLACRLWDRDYHIIGCNKESLRLFNVSSEQELIDRYFDLSPEYQPDGSPSTETAKKLIRRAFDGEKIIIEWEYCTLDGTLLPTEITLIRVPFEGDYAVAGYTRDLREYKKMMYEIERRERVLSIANQAAELLLTLEDIIDIEEAIMHSMEIVGCAVDVDRVQIWRNKTVDGELCFIHDYEWLSDSGRASGLVPIGLRFPYSDIPEWREMFLRGENVNGPVSRFSQEGKAFLQTFNMKSIAIIPLFLHDSFWGFFSIDDCRRERTFTEDEIDILGPVSLMIANAINRGKQAEVIKEAHERTRLLLDSAPYGTNLWNRDGAVFECNEASVKLFGLSSKQEYLDRFFDLSPEYQPDGQLSKVKAVAIIQEAFRTGRYECEWVHQMLDGTAVPAEAILVRVPYGDDFVVAGYTRDLREHNKMMREIERGEELLEAALIEAQKANRAKSDFLANMSHEMRTPLNAVIGLSGLCLDGGRLDAEDRSTIEKVYNSGSTLLNLVNDILDISKIEAGMLELTEVDYDVPSLINDTVTQNILRINEKPVKFILDIDEGIYARLRGDELRVKQIMNNLLSNAIKYTREGHVTLCIRCFREGGNVRFTIEVRDTGRGIKPEDIGKLFLDYAQLDLESNRAIEGTGLGLPITKNLAELMGGTINVESEYGTGSVFTVSILQKFIEETVISKETIESLKNFRYSEGRHIRHARISRIALPYARVLVVDDNQTNLDVAKGLMKPYGMQIDCVDSGQRAIDAIRANNAKYDAIFMDHMMPGMNGIEATKVIRELGTEYAEKIPVIALTANAISGSEEMFLNRGFQAFLSKPIDISRLDEVLRRWVRNKEFEKKYFEQHPMIAEELQAGIHNGQERRKADDRRSGIERRKARMKFAGMDMEKGKERFGGDRATYEEVLRSYTANTPALLDSIENINEDGLPAYAITVHGIKGSSRGIGADMIGDSAENLEHAAKAGDIDYVAKHNPVFLETARKLIRDLEDMLSDNGAENGKPTKAQPDNDALLKLLEACKAFSMDEAEDAMAEIDAYHYESDGGLADWLRENVNLTNFKIIIERLSTIVD